MKSNTLSLSSYGRQKFKSRNINVKSIQKSRNKSKQLMEIKLKNNKSVHRCISSIEHNSPFRCGSLIETEFLTSDKLTQVLWLLKPFRFAFNNFLNIPDIFPEEADEINVLKLHEPPFPKFTNIYIGGYSAHQLFIDDTTKLDKLEFYIETDDDLMKQYYHQEIYDVTNTNINDNFVHTLEYKSTLEIVDYWKKKYKIVPKLIFFSECTEVYDIQHPLKYVISLKNLTKYKPEELIYILKNSMAYNSKLTISHKIYNRKQFNVLNSLKMIAYEALHKNDVNNCLCALKTNYI